MNNYTRIDLHTINSFGNVSGGGGGGAYRRHVRIIFSQPAIDCATWCRCRSDKGEKESLKTVYAQRGTREWRGSLAVIYRRCVNVINLRVFCFCFRETDVRMLNAVRFRWHFSPSPKRKIRRSLKPTGFIYYKTISSPSRFHIMYKSNGFSRSVRP